ncbi:MAG: alpha/beta hydrolase [Acidimicrobiia bacterium]|nr:alpha/beta hydrolase [Acidimicrobiia bacterium]
MTAVREHPRLRITTDQGIGISAVSRPGIRPAAFLFVHGLASNARLWDGAADHLASRGYRSVAVDQRSHGQSDKVDGPFDFATLADDLLSVIDRSFPPETAVVAVGQSLGGNVVLELADRYPTRIAAIACIDGGFITLSRAFADWETAARELAPPSFDKVLYTDLEKALRKHYSDWPESGILGQLANFEVAPDGAARPHLERDHHFRLLAEMWRHRPCEIAPGIRQPVLVIASTRPMSGRAAKKESVSRFSKLLPRSRVIWLDAHHDLHAQYPRRTAGWLEELAQEVSP